MVKKTLLIACPAASLTLAEYVRPPKVEKGLKVHQLEMKPSMPTQQNEYLTTFKKQIT